MCGEDRLSSLPDELIHQILSFIDTKYAVQTCLLSSRWKLLWTSIPCLTFHSRYFGNLPKFAKFVTKVLSQRNHQIEVSSVKLNFHGAVSQVFVRKIANYAFSHNVQELTIITFPKNNHQFPPCLFSSQSHFTLRNPFFTPCSTPTIPWDFPTLTTLHLTEVNLCDDNRESIDLFSACFNLKNLTLNNFIVEAKVFDINTPQLSSLVLIDGKRINVINVISPQLENLSVTDCSINYLNAPPGVSYLCYKGYLPTQWLKERFHSLNKATVSLSYRRPKNSFNEQDAHESIIMLQDLHSARFLKLNINIVECISSFPELLSIHPSPFRNLICLNIDSSMRKDACEVKISTEAKKFLLDNSPNATFIMDLPEAKDIESHMMELQASVENVNMLLDKTNQAMERTKVSFEYLWEELQHVLTKKKIMLKDLQPKESSGLMEHIRLVLTDVRDLNNPENNKELAIFSKRSQIRSALLELPKQQRAEMNLRYSHLLQQAETLRVRILSTHKDTNAYFSKRMDDMMKILSDNVPSKPSSAVIPTPSTSSIDRMPETRITQQVNHSSNHTFDSQE